MVNKLWILLSALLMVAMPSAQAGELNLYSMNTGSYVYHMTGNHGQYNEHFNNNFFSVERKFSQDSKYSVLVGTMKNSFDDRCLTLGVRRDWLKNDTGWVLKGVYAYTGEFFFDAFSHCGDSGTYRTAKKITGMAFGQDIPMPPEIFLNNKNAARHHKSHYFGRIPCSENIGISLF